MSASVEVRKQDGVLVLPGEVLCGTDLKSGTGTYRREESIFSALLGLVNYRAGFVNVVPLGGRYSPRTGDSVIGMVQDVGASNWMVEMNSPYVAFLHANETQWKVEFGNAGQYLGIGDIVLAKVGLIDEVRHVNLTMKEQGLRKMTSGQVVRISPAKVPEVIGRGGTMISLLKERTACKIFVGQNGVIWMDGDPGDMARAVSVIRIIDRARGPGLGTDEVGELLARSETSRGGN